MLYRNSSQAVSPDPDRILMAQLNRELAVQDLQAGVWRLVRQRFDDWQSETGLRQADLARALGAPRSQVNAWLRRPENLTLKAAARLLHGMDARLTCSLAPGRADSDAKETAR